jgi:hypothetical protein
MSTELSSAYENKMRWDNGFGKATGELPDDDHSVTSPKVYPSSSQLGIFATFPGVGVTQTLTST